MIDTAHVCGAASHRHIVQKPFGTSPFLNRREYLLTRTMQSTLEHLAGCVGVHEHSVTAALRDFNARRQVLIGPAFRLLIKQGTSHTVQDGLQNANALLAAAGVKRSPLGAKAIPVSSSSLPPLPQKLQPAVKWGTLIDKMTDHTITHFDRIADDFKDRLGTSLKEGYANGEGAQDLTGRVQDALGIDNNRAAERARTLTMETYNQAHLVQYNDAGIPGTQVLAAEDERTCDYCGDMDGTIYALDDPDLIWPPFHNFCRCTLIPYLDEVPADAPQPSSDTVDFINNWSSTYFDIPAYYARVVA